MVQLTKGQYLIDYMMEMGPIISNGFGLIPRPDGAILDFFRGVGISLLPWEFMTLRRLCRAYAAEYADAKDKFSISPMDRASWRGRMTKK